MLMSLEDIKIILRRSENKKLREFIFFIAGEYLKVKSNINQHQGYSDYYCFCFEINLISIKLERDPASLTEKNALQDNIIWEIIYYRMFGLNDKASKINNSFTTVNDLIEVSFKNFSCLALSDLIQDYYFEIKNESLSILDICYTQINEKSNSFPILLIEHNFYLENKDQFVTVNFPTIYFCADPFPLYLVKMYFDQIKYQMMIKMIKDIKNSTSSEFLPEKVIDTKIITKQINPLSKFNEINVKFEKILINLNKTMKDNTEKSILIALNKINVSFQKIQNKMNFTIKEVVCGSIDNLQVWNFLIRKQVFLKYKTIILNQFDNAFLFNFEDGTLVIEQDETLIEFKNHDVQSINNYFNMFESILVFEEYNPVLRQNQIDLVIPDEIDDYKQLFFFHITLKKLCFKLTFSRNQKLLSTLRSSLPSFVIIFIEQPKFTLCSWQSRSEMMLTMKNIGIGSEPLQNLNLSMNSDQVKINKIFDMKSRFSPNISNFDDFLTIQASETLENLIYLKISNKSSNEKIIKITLTPFQLIFDYELFKYLLEYFKRIRKSNEKKDEFLTKLMIGSSKKPNSNQRLKTISLNENNLLLTLINEQANIRFLYNGEIFLQIEIVEIDLFYLINQTEMKLSCKLRSITDHRKISINNKDIFSGDSKVTLTLKENKMQVEIENPKILYLNRVLMDIVEYFYYILIIEVLGLSSNDSLNKIEEIEKEKTYSKQKNKKVRSLKKISSPSLEPQRLKEKFLFTLIIRKGEVMISLNSLKKNKLSLFFDELEFSNLSSQNQQNYYYELSEKLEIQYKEQLVSSIENLKLIIKIKNAKICNGVKNKERQVVKFNEFARFSEENNKDGLMILIDINDEDNLFHCNLYCLANKLKLKLYPDCYQSLLRIFFENLFEEYNVFSQATKKQFTIDPKTISPVYPFFQMWLLFDSIRVSLFSFPSACLYHKEFEDYARCQIHYYIENRCLEKFASLSITKMTYYFGFLTNYLNNSSVSAEDLSIELNKKFTLFSHVSQLKLLEKKFENKQKMVLIEIRKHFDKILDFDIFISSAKIFLTLHPILTLKNLFARFFLYYYNSNIKTVDFNEIPKKRTNLTMKKCVISLGDNLTTNDTNYILDILCNTYIGPFESQRKLFFYIKKIFLNTIKHSEVKLSNQILSVLCLYLETNCDSNVAQQLENINYYIYLSQYSSEQNFILFKNERIPEFTYRNGWERLKETPKLEIKLRSPSILLNEMNTIKFHEEKIIYINEESKDDNEDNDNHNIRISLIQIFQLQQILQNLKNCMDIYYHSDILKYINKFKSSFDKLKYLEYYGFDFKKIDIILNDSSFNSKLFKFSIPVQMTLICNSPLNTELNRLDNLMKKYKHFFSYLQKSDEGNERNKKSTDIIKKYSIFGNIIRKNQIKSDSFLINNNEVIFPKFNYYIATKTLLSIYFHNNNNLKWEPFIEPFPLYSYYFSNDYNKFIHFDIASLEKLDIGVDELSRQKNFHSLNINMSESLIENIKAFKNDFNKTNNTDLHFEHQEKKLVLVNYTDCQYEILDDTGFLHENEEAEFKIKRVLKYSNRKLIDYKEEIKIEFVTYTPIQEKKKQITGTFKKATFNDFPEIKENNDKGRLCINIEKSCKFYFLMTLSASNTLKTTEDVLENFKDQNNDKNIHEIIKNFDESILLEKEQFLIADVVLNVEKNQKTVIFRSNYGIINLLDFKVKIKYIFKEGNNAKMDKYLKERIVYFVKIDNFSWRNLLYSFSDFNKINRI